MIPEVGHFALILALAVAAVQGSLPAIGAARRSDTLMAVAGPAAIAQFLLVGTAFSSLMYAYVVSDFTVVNVVENSHSAKPMLYKITGVWGNHEGSMLLWILMLAGFGAAVALFGQGLPATLKARALAVQAWIAAGFLTFTVFTSNPFLRVFPPPANGNDLNPLLQDPGLAFHPPMLYAGYVGFSMAFSFAIAGLIEGRADAAWARWVRPWALIAWIFLTAGVALGSWWAYYELGWGGWWFWDPVENVSFMPWLLGTALLHSAIVVEKRDTLKVWTVLLAILTFSFSLIGTFVVRSGVLTSVHAFATDPERGVFILALLSVAIGGSLILFAVRAPLLRPGGMFAPVSREGGLVLNNLLLVTATVTVFLGTMYPLFLDAVGGGKVSVGPPFYSATFVPLMTPLVAVMAVGPFLQWKRADLVGVAERLKIVAIITLLAALTVAYVTDGGSVLAVLAMGLAAWLFIGALVEWAGKIKLFRVPVRHSLARAAGLPRAAHGMTLAHAGLGVAIAGMIASTAWKVEEIRVMRPGETVEVGGYTYQFDGVRSVEGPNYSADRGTFTVTTDGRAVTVLEPERRSYLVQQRETTEAAIHTTGLADLYAVVGQSDDKGGWTVRLYHQPGIPWIWAGAALMVIGGAFSLSDRRLRVGTPLRRLKPTATTA
ncbi:MAG: c-type cytochrome biogenesis protein CcmF [Rhizobiales bacterium NRL2]|jgi:cytochrome c-type biogenesis protein CcmF|nr:MAG: c-type cytochrome biogenesis protein CcmF [Rhizobiales bacterium NRL2]